MFIHRKIASFAILQASWITWLLVGFSTGGIAVVLERIITLVGRTRTVRRFTRRFRRHQAPGCSSVNLALSSSW